MRQRRLREWLQQAWRKALPFLLSQLPHTTEEQVIVFTFATLLFLYLTTPPEEPLPPPKPPPPALEQHLPPAPLPLRVLTETPDSDEPAPEETLPNEQEVPSADLLLPPIHPLAPLEDEEENSWLEGEEELDRYSLAGDAEECEESDEW